MKTYAPALVAALIVGAILIGVTAWIPRRIFIMMIPFAVVGVAAAFTAKKKRALALVLIFLGFAGVGFGRVDIVLQRHGAPRGIAFQKVVWGKVTFASEGAYLAGCEPPRFEPTRVLVIRI